MSDIAPATDFVNHKFNPPCNRQSGQKCFCLQILLSHTLQVVDNIFGGSFIFFTDAGGLQC